MVKKKGGFLLVALVLVCALAGWTVAGAAPAYARAENWAYRETEKTAAAEEGAAAELSGFAAAFWAQGAVMAAASSAVRRPYFTIWPTTYRCRRAARSGLAVRE